MDPLNRPLAPANANNDKPAPWRRRVAIVLAIAFGSVLVWALLQPSPLPMEIARAGMGPMQVAVENEGQVRAHDRYIVAAPVAGRLARVELHDGDPVRREQLVATLDPVPMDVRETRQILAKLDAARAMAGEARLAVQRVEASLRLAARERARVEQLVTGRFLSAQALDKAQVAEQTAMAEAQAARSRLDAANADVRAAQAAAAAAQPGPQGPTPLQLVSPVEGYVLKVNEKSSRTVAAGTPIVTIGNPAHYEIVVDVLSTDAVKIRPNDTMLLEGWGGPQALRARVDRVEPVAFTKVSALGIEEQRVNVIGEPVDGLQRLGDGYRVEARIIIWSADRVLRIPASALFRAGEAWHVFRVENGRAREFAVQVGHRNALEAEILSGLQDGAVVLRYPGNQIRDGTRVTVDTAQER